MVWLNSVLQIVIFCASTVLHCKQFFSSSFSNQFFFSALYMPSPFGSCGKWGCRNSFNPINREFFRTWWNLNEVPWDIPIKATKVHLDGNNLTSLSSGVFNHLSECTSLYLGQNQIAYIEPGAFSGLTRLRFLLLVGNELTLIERDTFRALRSLVMLNLRQNQIFSVKPGRFLGLVSLLNLDLGNNQINNMEPNAFAGLPSLKTLNLQGNKIQTLQPGVFYGMISLENLALHRNELTTIQHGAFSGFGKLKHLKLQANQLLSLGVGCFNGLKFLKMLLLDSNKLTSLPQDLFANLSRPLELSLTNHIRAGGSLWNCSSMCWLKQEEREKTITWSPMLYRNDTPPLQVSSPSCAGGEQWEHMQYKVPGKWETCESWSVDMCVCVCVSVWLVLDMVFATSLVRVCVHASVCVCVCVCVCTCVIFDITFARPTDTCFWHDLCHSYCRSNDIRFHQTKVCRSGLGSPWVCRSRQVPLWRHRVFLCFRILSVWISCVMP